VDRSVAAGVAFVATLRGEAGRDIVDHALTALRNLDHQGSTSTEDTIGDGAGILTQIPDAYMRDLLACDLPVPGAYAVGAAFLPSDPEAAAQAQAAVEAIAVEEGLKPLIWRDVPTNPEVISPTARGCMPHISHLALCANPRSNPPRAGTPFPATLRGIDLDRKAFRVARRAAHEVDVHFPSLSSRTLVYKGMLTADQLPRFFPDLMDLRYATELALVHARFSTGTQASWELAQPFSLIARNGAVTTIEGNRAWLNARASQARSSLLGDLAHLTPLCPPGLSDSASLNTLLELLHLSGRSLPRALLMAMPEAWENHARMDPSLRAFYQHQSMITEPWDGPACVAFTDGTFIGAALDRNGLRPGRFWVTKDGLVIFASEVGVLEIPPHQVVRKGRLGPGRMLLLDLEDGRLVEDREIKSRLASGAPYRDWLTERCLPLTDLPPAEPVPAAPPAPRPPGSLFDAFTPLLAQVTSTPIDVVRERVVTSLVWHIGPEPSVLSETPDHARKLLLPAPVIDNDDLAKIVAIDRTRQGAEAGFSSTVISGLFPASEGGDGLARRLSEIFAEVDRAISAGHSFLILSDQSSTEELAPIPSLLLTSAVHHHLMRRRTRTMVSLLVEAGDVREAQHVALLLGYGASAVNPYVLTAGVEKHAINHVITTLCQDVLAIMGRAGITTVGSYCGTQAFEVTGLAQDLIDAHFTGTPARAGDITLDTIAREIRDRTRAPAPDPRPHLPLATPTPSPIPLDEVEPASAIVRRFMGQATPDGPLKPVPPDRAGVNVKYLASADELRITMAQGHHDAVSVEDLRQLISDLAHANPRARIQVEIVAQAGVGSTAAGVAKAGADVVVLSTHDGGMWEASLAETQQALLADDLRSRIVVALEGPLDLGRDVVIAALLGAEECGVPKAARESVAEEVRELLASLGLRTFDEAVGRATPTTPLHATTPQDHRLDTCLDRTLLIPQAKRALTRGEKVTITGAVRNVHDSVGTLLGYEVYRRHPRGLAEATIEIDLTGSAGQSFGAFLPGGVELRLTGDANDYLAKGLSGGRVIVRPAPDAPFHAAEATIAGNVIGYGATSGQVFCSGQVGERFAVCNAGADLVAEGTGDHACELMTGGCVVILGPTGRNLASGMTGGAAYVLDLTTSRIAPGALESGAILTTTLDQPSMDDDVTRLIDLLRRHVAQTWSRVGAEILAQLDRDRLATLHRFTRIGPYAGGRCR